MNRGNLEAIYARRFAATELRRNQVWQVLTQHYFQRWIKPTDSVLDVGAGYCEFINNIKAEHKLALDLNPMTPIKASPAVSVLTEDVTEPWTVPASSVDVVFSSNFFEHLPSKKDLNHCLSEIHRVLRPQGLLIAMGPNIRHCYNVYWDFFDHYLPLSDRSMAEAAEVAGFRMEHAVPQFLPFAIRGKLPPLRVLVRLYLLFPPAWRVFGKQFLLILRKV
jgi:SAM-dependent methyltransferase